LSQTNTCVHMKSV